MTTTSSRHRSPSAVAPAVFSARRQLVLGVGIVNATWIILLFQTLKTDHGQTHLVYALDDPYIHMALAKNMVQHGVWGISRYAFSAASSSPLWTLLLAVVYAITGPHELAPFVLNVFFANGVLGVAYGILRAFRVARLYAGLAVVGIVFLAPLPALVFTGMEHILQTGCVLLFAFVLVRVVSVAQTRIRSRDTLALLSLALVMTAVRYEGLFMVCIAVGLLLARRHWVQAVLLGVFGCMPPLIYGTVSVINGGFWLPNSILVKSHSLEPAKILNYLTYDKSDAAVITAPHLLALCVTALALYALRFTRTRDFWDSRQLLLLIFLITTFMHVQLAGLGWFYRYEAYLVVLGLVAITVAALDQTAFPVRLSWHAVPYYVMLAVLGFLLLRPLTDRGLRSLGQIPRATTNIYEQQYQMGLFLHRYYPGIAVAANDVGAIDYLADIHVVDLWGLGNADIARKTVNGTYTVQDVIAITQAANVKIAIVYSPLYPLTGSPHENLIPATWQRVRVWTVENRLVLGDTSVIFYAVDPAVANQLRANLKQFAPELPATVKQTP